MCPTMGLSGWIRLEELLFSIMSLNKIGGFTIDRTSPRCLRAHRVGHALALLLFGTSLSSETVMPGPLPQNPVHEAGDRFRGKIVTYKLKLSEGSGWTNLKPESWLLITVSDGKDVTLKHSTNSVNKITGFSRWWDHPITESRACRIEATAQDQRPKACLRGSSQKSGRNLSHGFSLPPGDTIHDYLLEVKWLENKKEQEAITRVKPSEKPGSTQPMPGR